MQTKPKHSIRVHTEAGCPLQYLTDSKMLAEHYSAHDVFTEPDTPDGWQLLGRGSFSRVLRKGVQGPVFRVSLRRDDGTRAYHRMILQGVFHENGVRYSCVPHVHSTLSWDAGRGFVTALEYLPETLSDRLLAAHPDEDDGSGYVAASRRLVQPWLLENIPAGVLVALERAGEGWAGECPEDTIADPHWAHVLSTLMDVGIGALDVHSQNVMYRGDTLVIIDPCSWRDDFPSDVGA